MALVIPTDAILDQNDAEVFMQISFNTCMLK